MTVVPLAPPKRLVDLEVDGTAVRVPEGSTILDALRAEGVDTPTLCYADNLTPVNACRVCVVELEGSRVLVPSCARKAEAGMKIRTDSERVRLSRKMVLEFLGSSVDISLTGSDVERWQADYGADASRYGPEARPAAAGERDDRHPATTTSRAADRRRRRPTGQGGQRALRPRLLQVHPLLQVRRGVRRGRAEHVRHRRRRARIRRPHLNRVRVALPDSACVYCGNCIGVCPTGALMFKSEHDIRETGAWDESSRPSPRPSARTAAWAAAWRCMCRKTRSSRSRRPRTTT